MKILPVAAVLALSLGLGMGCSSQPKVDELAEVERVNQVVEQYIQTINNDETTLVNQIWSHGDEVSFIAPSGRYSTYNEIRDSLVHGLFGLNFTQRNLQKEKLSIHVNGPSAWAEFEWKFSAIRVDGSPHNTVGRETQIFEKDADGNWRLVHIHYSGRSRG